MILMAISLLISASSLNEMAYIAESFADSNPKIQFRKEADRGVFTGEIERLEDKQIIQEMVERSDSKISDQTKFSPDLLKAQKKELESMAIKMGSSARFRVRDRNLWVYSALASERNRFLKLFPFLKHETLAKTKEPTGAVVRLELAFVELRKEAIERLGLRFGSPIEFSSSIHLKKISTGRGLVGVEGGNPIGSFLDFILKEGEGRVHFKQSIVGQDGKRAHFKVGGEFSLRLNTENFSQLGKIEYGIDLDYVPRLLADRNIHLSLRAQIREPDLSGGIDGLPLIQTKDLSSELFAKLGETMAIGGFVRSQESRSNQSLPLLGEIPFFGRLLSSKDFLANRSEAYLFITPHRLAPGGFHVD